MYNRFYYDKYKNTVHLWDDVTGYSKFEYAPYAYIIANDGKYVTMDGQKVNKVTSWSETSEQLGMIYEHDVQTDMRVLIDRYHASEEIATNRILFFDIEVRKNQKHSEAADATNEITAISYYHTDSDMYHVLLFDESFECRTLHKQINIPNPSNDNLAVQCEIIFFNDESDLLEYFIKEFKKIDPTILTGWNIDYYDIPYLYNRIVRILGANMANSLSPIGIVTKHKHGNKDELKIAGISSLDFIGLYKKFSTSEQPNYKLNTIASIELGRGKVEYSGSLDSLMKNNLDLFIAYSITDTELIVSMDKKLDYISIAVGICHSGRVPYDSIHFTSKYIEGAILTELKNMNIIAISSSGKHEDSASGAAVVKPIPGLYKWLYDLDLLSLYPWNIISLNISPETKLGHILQWNYEEFMKNIPRSYEFKFKDLNIVEFYDFETSNESKYFESKLKLMEFLRAKNFSIASNGVIYDLNKIGIIPGILKKWFGNRLMFQENMKVARANGDHNLEQQYHKKQYITKIKLNSAYGVLLLQSFRFYDKQNGEAVTSTGRSIIGYSIKVANKYYNDILKDVAGMYQIESEDGEIKLYNAFDMVNTQNGKKYIFMLKPGDIINE